MPQPAFNVSAAVFQNKTKFCLQCLFHDDSASACLLIYYSLMNTHYDELIYLNMLKIDRVQKKADGCIETPNQDKISHHVNIAVFAFSSEKDMMYGQPLTELIKETSNIEEGIANMFFLS